MNPDLNRRDVFRLLTAAGVAFPLALPAAEPGAPLYFTKEEFALLDTLTELVIPADEHSPGAHAAGVATYIDKSVAEAFLEKDKSSWRNGLASVNRISQSMHGAQFTKLSKDQQVQVLTSMSQKEDAREMKKEGDSAASAKRNSSEAFFGQLKNTTAFAYYTSAIGIHKEMNYKGNVLLQEFVGYMPDDPLPPLASL